MLGTTSLAQDPLSPRLQIGINLLPAIVAANQSLAATDIDRNLPIYLVYRENRYQGEQLRQRIDQVGKRFIEQEAAILAVISDEPRLHSNTKKKATKYIGRFYKTIKNPDDFERLVIEKCRK